MITDMDALSTTDFRAIENHFPIVSTEITFHTKPFQTIKPNVIADFKLELYPNSSETFRNMSLVFTERTYANLDPLLVDQILKFYNETSIVFDTTNETNVMKENVLLKFPYSGNFDMYIFAFTKDNRLISYVYHDNVFILESNQLDEKIALDTVRNGIRLEGLTLGGLGIALLMFLLEIGIKKDN